MDKIIKENSKNTFRNFMDEPGHKDYMNNFSLIFQDLEIEETDDLPGSS